MGGYTRCIGTGSTTMHSRVWLTLSMIFATFSAESAAGQDGRTTSSVTVRIEHLLTIGVEDGAEEYLFTAPVGIGIGPQGEVVVLDARERNVRVYDRNGRFLRKAGRAGGGPGEFTNPLSLVVLDTVAYVADLNGRLTAFSLSGRYLWDRTLPHVSGGVAQRMLPLRYDHWLALRSGVYSNVATDNRELLLLFRAGNADVDTISAHDPGSVLYSRPDFPMLAPTGTRLGAEVVWAVAGDSMVALVNGYRGIVQWFTVTPRGLSKIAERTMNLQTRRVSRSDADNIQEAIQRRYSQWPNLRVIPPEYYGAASAALIDTEGRVWINRRAGSERTDDWLIVSQDTGTPIQRLLVPQGFGLRLVHDDKLYGTDRTANGAPVIRVFRLR